MNALFVGKFTFITFIFNRNKHGKKNWYTTGMKLIQTWTIDISQDIIMLAIPIAYAGNDGR